MPAQCPVLAYFNIDQKQRCCLAWLVARATHVLSAADPGSTPGPGPSAAPLLPCFLSHSSALLSKRPKNVLKNIDLPETVCTSRTIGFIRRFQHTKKSDILFWCTQLNASVDFQMQPYIFRCSLCWRHPHTVNCPHLGLNLRRNLSSWRQQQDWWRLC